MLISRTRTQHIIVPSILEDVDLYCHLFLFIKAHPLRAALSIPWKDHVILNSDVLFIGFPALYQTSFEAFQEHSNERRTMFEWKKLSQTLNSIKMPIFLFDILWYTVFKHFLFGVNVTDPVAIFIHNSCHIHCNAAIDSSEIRQKRRLQFTLKLLSLRSWYVPHIYLLLLCWISSSILDVQILFNRVVGKN